MSVCRVFSSSTSDLRAETAGVLAIPTAHYFLLKCRLAYAVLLVFVRCRILEAVVSTATILPVTRIRKQYLIDKVAINQSSQDSTAFLRI